MWFRKGDDITATFHYIHCSYINALRRQQEIAVTPELNDLCIKLYAGELIVDNINSPFHGMLVSEYLQTINKIYKHCNTVVYFLCKNKAVVYVGSSGNLAQRLPLHKDKDYDEVAFVFGGLELEYKYQLLFRPKYNKQLGKNYISNPNFVQ